MITAHTSVTKPAGGAMLTSAGRLSHLKPRCYESILTISHHLDPRANALAHLLIFSVVMAQDDENIQENSRRPV